jgi:hypothetical protein
MINQSIIAIVSLFFKKDTGLEYRLNTGVHLGYPRVSEYYIEAAPYFVFFSCRSGYIFVKLL